MRKKIVAANWKMNTTVADGEKLVSDILLKLPDRLTCSVILAPPFTHLPMLIRKIEGSQIHSAAQTCHEEKSGAFTGEISVEMLKGLGIEYVIVGHSERRQIFHETNEVIKCKVDAILHAGLIPIFCCGEPLDIRETETQNIYVRSQLEESLFHLDPDSIAKVCIAYEPIWAIGTGVTATPEQAQEMHHFIRDKVTDRYSKLTGELIHILYGGSLKPDNAKQLFSKEDVDGGLIGGASLNAASFLEIINAAC